MLFAGFIFITSLSFAQENTAENSGAIQPKEKECVQSSEEFSETFGEVTINGRIIKYKATAGNLILKDENCQPKASLFFISYAKIPENSAASNKTARRPVTFCFNGGPGSSAVWLNIGLLGPRRIALNEEGDPLLPFHLIENDYSLLDETDLVFIDPISTGYSRAIPGSEAKKYHEVMEDIRSIAEFIRIYLSRYDYWESPKFIAGESYGTTRAVALAGYLHEHYFLPVNGLILVSSVLNFQTIDFSKGTDFAYLTFLPSYTAAAWYHQKLAPELQRNLQQTLNQVRDFVINDYSVALLKGDLLSPIEKSRIEQRLVDFTGLPLDFIQKSNLRISWYQFTKELLLSKKRTIGRFDARFKGVDDNLLGNCHEYDPSANVIFGPFTVCYNHYLKNELKWKTDMNYRILANIAGQWDYGVAKNQYLNVSDTLRDVIVRNPSLRVFVGNGYYDLATPFFGTEATFNHLNLEPQFRDHISMEYYESGHMMYIHRPSLIKMKADLARFFENTLNHGEKTYQNKTQ